MRSLTYRLLLSFLVLLVPAVVYAHDVTVTGTNTFAALDGSASDHDGAANGVFTVSDGNLTIAGTVNCNDDTTTSACSMAFSASGDITVTGALYAENRSGGGTGGSITLSAGRDLAMSAGAIVSTSSKSSSGSTGGNITASVSRNVSLASGSTIDAGSANARAGNITVSAGGAVSVDGNVLSGPSRTILTATRLTGAALDGGTSNQIGGEIRISSSSFAEPAVLVGTNANIVSQGDVNGAGPVILEGCGISITGHVAALGRKDSATKVSIRSGKDLFIDSQDLGVAGATLGRNGRVRSDATSGTSINRTLELLGAETVTILGPASASSSQFPLTSLAGVHDSKSVGGLIRVVSTEDAVIASGNVADDGRSAAGDTGGPIDIAAKGDVNLATAVIRSFGDSSTNNPARGGGSINVRSYSGNIIWTNGLGDVRPTGSASGLPPVDQGTITLTACGTVNTTGSSFPVNGSPTGPWPAIATGSCSPAAPSLPVGVVLVTCNTPPVANDAAASTNEDTTVTITLSGTDADGDSLTFSIVSGPSNGVLGPITQVTATSATVDYTPNANFFGTDSFVYQANDGNGGTDNATVAITVAPVNDPPSFQAGPTAISLEDAGPQTVSPWATGISAGPANESGQTVTFTVTNDNPSLFSVQPSVDSGGTLTYTSALNASGSANVTITAQDNGGTANGGDDTSNPQTSAINVTPVNDAPSFTKGADQSVGEDAGPQTVSPWATGISAGPNESQTVSFVASNNKPALFSAQPAVAADGTLTYTPAADASGSATVTVYAQDDGGTANGGVDQSAPQTFTITVSAVNDPPSFNGSGDVTVLEDSAPYSATWATSISPGPADESAQTVSFSVTNTNNSLFSVQPGIDSNGVLTFTLNANAFGSASVSVTATDNGVPPASSAPQSFTITVDPVNDAPSFVSGGDVTVNEDSGPHSMAWATSISAGPNESGQTLTFFASNDNAGLFSSQPSISSTGVLTFNTAANASGSALVTVYLKDNGGTLDGGADTSPSVTFTITVNQGNDPPQANADAYDTIGNTLLQVAAAKSVSDPAVFVTGSVLANDTDPDSGSLTAALVGASVTPGASVTMNADGSFTYVPPAGHAAATDSFSYTVSDGTASSTGTVTITLKSRVWYVRNNTAAGSGRSNDPFNTLPSGEAVSVPGDTIFIFTGDGTTLNQDVGFMFKSNQRLLGQGVALTVPVSVNGGPATTQLMAAGTKPRITNVGGNAITIDGVSNVLLAGLAIENAMGDGVNILNASSVSVATVSITGSQGNGIVGSTVAGFNLDGSTVTGNGDSALLDEGQLKFSELTGNAMISNSTIGGSVEDNVRIVNTAGVLNRVTFNNVTFGAVHATTGNDSMFIQANGTATVNVTVQNSVFTSARGDLFQYSIRDSAAGDLVFTGNALSNNHPNIASGGGGFTISSGSAPLNATLTYSITNNTFRDAVGSAISIGKGGVGTGAFSGSITNNTIGVSSAPNSGSLQGSAIALDIIGGGTHTVAVTNNQISQYTNYGILLAATNTISGGGQGKLVATVQGNTIGAPSLNSAIVLFPTSGVRLNSGSTSGDNAKVCLTLGGAGALANSLTGTGTNGGADVRLFQRFLTTVALPGYAGANNDNTAVANFVKANNGGTPNVVPTNTVSTGGGGFVGTCPP